MIAFLEGTLMTKTPEEVIVMAGGVGYRLFVPLTTFYGLPEIGDKVGLRVHTHHRQDDMVLFGFLTEQEKTLFLALLSVAGIGPRLSRNILSGMAVEDLTEAISRGDVARIVSIPGVGQKTAQRIVLELQGKLVEAPVSPAAHPKPTSPAYEDALSALLNLGYKKREAEEALGKIKIDEEPGDLGRYIRAALRYLAGQKR